MKIEDISKRSCDYSMAPFNMPLPFHLMDMGTFPSRHLRVTHFVSPFLLKKQACTHRTDCNWKTDSAKQGRLTYDAAKLSLWEKPASLTKVKQLLQVLHIPILIFQPVLNLFWQRIKMASQCFGGCFLFVCFLVFRRSALNAFTFLWLPSLNLSEK